MGFVFSRDLQPTSGCCVHNSTWELKIETQGRRDMIIIDRDTKARSTLPYVYVLNYLRMAPGAAFRIISLLLPSEKVFF
jgi:hypothetical protein